MTCLTTKQAYFHSLWSCRLGWQRVIIFVLLSSSRKSRTFASYLISPISVLFPLRYLPGIAKSATTSSIRIITLTLEKVPRSESNWYSSKQLSGSSFGTPFGLWNVGPGI
ncbi:unnamed protein product [Victoria cruziana]